MPCRYGICTQRLWFFIPISWMHIFKFNKTTASDNIKRVTIQKLAQKCFSAYGVHAPVHQPQNFEVMESLAFLPKRTYAMPQRMADVTKVAFCRRYSFFFYCVGMIQMLKTTATTTEKINSVAEALKHK